MYVYSRVIQCTVHIYVLAPAARVQEKFDLAKESSCLGELEPIDSTDAKAGILLDQNWGTGDWLLEVETQ